MEQATQPRGDSQLIAEFLIGRNNAFTALFERYHRLVRVAIWNFFHNRDVIDDLCQEAFLKAYTNLPSLKDKNRFKPWLLQIAFRLCVDQQRRHAHERSALEKTAREPQPTNPEPKPAEPDDPVILRMLNRQNPLDCLLVWLRHVEGFPYDEIATITELTEVAIRQKVSRALRSMKEQME